MSIKTEYTCDKCAHSQPDPSKPCHMYETIVQFRPAGNPYGAYTRSITPSPIVCEECLTKFQINVKPKEGEAVLSLADKLTAVLSDFISEEVSTAMSNQ
jgi:hypothetical protein